MTLGLAQAATRRQICARKLIDFNKRPIWGNTQNMSNLRVLSAMREDLVFVPDFLSLPEQRLLLETSLKKLNNMESRAHKKRRRLYAPTRLTPTSEDLQSTFLPDDYYDFQEV
jgi:hypothetical protein